MLTVKVKIPQGYEVDSFDERAGEVILRPKGKKRGTEILTVDDVLAYHDLTRQEFDLQCVGLTKDEVAYRIIKLLAQALNEDWQPNWDDSREYKYFPWFYMDRGSSGFRFCGCDGWGSNSNVGSRLCFKSNELAEHAGKQFTEVYKEFMVID